MSRCSQTNCNSSGEHLARCLLKVPKVTLRLTTSTSRREVTKLNNGRKRRKVEIWTKSSPRWAADCKDSRLKCAGKKLKSKLEEGRASKFVGRVAIDADNAPRADLIVPFSVLSVAIRPRVGSDSLELEAANQIDGVGRRRRFVKGRIMIQRLARRIIRKMRKDVFVSPSCRLFAGLTTKMINMNPTRKSNTLSSWSCE